MSKNNYLKSKGYTLTEMLVVISVLIILVMINLPLFKQYQPTLKLKGEAKNLGSDMRYAQQLTLSEQKTHLTRFYPAEAKYEIIKILNENEENESEEVIKEVFLQSPVIFESITFTDNEVSFNTAGGSSEAGEAILTNNEKTITVEVKPSGYIKITE